MDGLSEAERNWALYYETFLKTRYSMLGAQAQAKETVDFLQQLELGAYEAPSDTLWQVMLWMVNQTRFSTEGLRKAPGRYVRESATQRTWGNLAADVSFLYGAGASGDPRFADVSLAQPAKVAARLIWIFAPSFTEIVPAGFRAGAAPPFARTGEERPAGASKEDVAEAVRKAMREEVRRTGESPPSPKAEAAVADAIRQMTDVLKNLSKQTGSPGITPEQIREAVAAGVRIGLAGTRPPPVPPPVSVPPPFVPQAPPAAAAEFHAAARNIQQQNLFGATVRPVEQAPPSLAAQLEDKYRPVFLNQVIGNAKAVEVLQAAALTGGFGKAYLVVGPSGVGKTSTVAAAIRDYLLTIPAGGGRELFNPRPPPENPTMGIDPAVLFRRTAMQVTARGGIASLFGELGKFASLQLRPGVRRFVILDDVQDFTERQQLDLHSLTESYPRVTFFFVANKANFSTAVLSRLMRVVFSAPEREAVVARLVEIIEQEGFPFPDAIATAKQVVGRLGIPDFRQAIIALANEVNLLRLRQMEAPAHG